MAEDEVHVLVDQSGGLNKGTNLLMMKDNEFEHLLNISLDTVGAAEKRKGYAQKGGDVSASGDILGIGSYNSADGNTNALFVKHGTDLYKWTSAVGWTAQSLSLQVSQKAEFTPYYDHLFMVDGKDGTARCFNGSVWSTTTNLGDAPAAEYIHRYGVRLCMGNCKIPQGGTFSSRVFHSDTPLGGATTWGLETGADLVQTAASATVTSATATFTSRYIKAGDPLYILSGANEGQYEVASVTNETTIVLTEELSATATTTFWVGGNWFDVATDDGDTIQGMGSNSDRLLVFKRSRAFRWDGSTPTEIRGAVGTTSHRSIKNVRDLTIYFHPTGFYAYNGVTSQLISNPIKPYLDGIAAAYYGEVAAMVIDNRRYRAFVGDISNAKEDISISNAFVEYDVSQNTWTIGSYPDEVLCAVDFVESGATNTYFGTDSAQVQQAESGYDDDGISIPIEMETKEIFPGGPMYVKRFKRVFAVASKGAELTLYGRVDRGEWKKIGELTDRVTDLLIPSELPRGRGIQFKISGESKTETFRYEGLIFINSAEGYKK